MSVVWRALLPKEHGLWCWFGAPLLASVALAPGGVTLGGSALALAAFLAGNAARAAWKIPLSRRPHAPLDPTPFEVGFLVGACALGVGLAVAGGSPAPAALQTEGALACWELTGLWWVRGALARVLPGRAPWRSGRWIVPLALAAFALLCWRWGAPWVGLLPLGYALRIALTRPVTAAKDARRIGLGELAWTLGVGALAVVGTRFAIAST